MTQTEFDTLKDKLAAMPSEALAAFIAELAVTSDRVRGAIEIFAERKNPSKLTSALRKPLRVLERNERFNHYREAQTMVRRLDDWLDRIEQDLLPPNPEEAIELLGSFFNADARGRGSGRLQLADQGKLLSRLRRPRQRLPPSAMSRLRPSLPAPLYLQAPGLLPGLPPTPRP